jgi:hypothetical protein
VKSGKRLDRAKKWDDAEAFAWVCGELRDGKLLVRILTKMGMSERKWWEIHDATDERQKLYQLARKKSGAAMLDHVRNVSEGKDALSRRRRKEFNRLKSKLLKKGDPYVGQKIGELESLLIQRNKLQIDASKWYARMVDHDRYGDRQRMSIDGGDEDGNDRKSITIEFVDPQHDEPDPPDQP